jgi:hypothetical protein
MQGKRRQVHADPRARQVKKNRLPGRHVSRDSHFAHEKRQMPSRQVTLYSSFSGHKFPLS